MCPRALLLERLIYHFLYAVKGKKGLNQLLAHLCKSEQQQNQTFKTNQSSDILQHSQNRPTGDCEVVKVPTYDIPDHKIKLKTQQFQVMVKNTRQINNRL